MDRLKSDVKKIRYRSLHQLFKQIHGHEPSDKFHSYILKLIINLGEVYDENMEGISRLIRLGAVSKFQDPGELERLKPIKKQLDELRDREAVLDSVGRLLRRVIKIDSKGGKFR